MTRRVGRLWPSEAPSDTLQVHLCVHSVAAATAAQPRHTRNDGSPCGSRIYDSRHSPPGMQLFSPSSTALRSAKPPGQQPWPRAHNSCSCWPNMQPQPDSTQMHCSYSTGNAAAPPLKSPTVLGTLPDTFDGFRGCEPGSRASNSGKHNRFGKSSRRNISRKHGLQ